MESMFTKSLEQGQARNSELLIGYRAQWCWAIFASGTTGVRIKLGSKLRDLRRRQT